MAEPKQNEPINNEPKNVVNDPKLVGGQPTAATDPKPASKEPAIDIAKLIEEKLAEAKKKWDEEATRSKSEEEKLAKLTEEQKNAYKQDKKAKELEVKEAELKKRELELKAKDILISKSLPVELAVALDYSDEESCNKSIDALAKVFEDAVQEKVKEKIKGGKPIKKATNEPTGDDDTALIFKTMMGR